LDPPAVAVIGDYLFIAAIADSEAAIGDSVAAIADSEAAIGDSVAAIADSVAAIGDSVAEIGDRGYNKLFLFHDFPE
jgi:hypothetical protein